MTRKTISKSDDGDAEDGQRQREHGDDALVGAQFLHRRGLDIGAGQVLIGDLFRVVVAADQLIDAAGVDAAAIGDQVPDGQVDLRIR